MDFPTVTVIVPAYNMERYVEQTLLSAINQTYSNLEIVVVNDGSTDGTRAIVERIALAHPKIRVASVANRGVAAARNLGIDMADSLYVAFLDADDVWHPTKIERQVAALASHGHSPEWGACYTLYRMIDPLDRVLGDGPASEERGDFFDAHLAFNHVGNGSNLLVRRDLALAVGGFNAAYARQGIGGCEDLEFQLKLLRRTKMELVREYLIGYRLHSAQMSSDIVKMRMGHIAVIEHVSAEFPVPRPLRDRALVQLYLAVAKSLLIVRQSRSAIRWLASSMALDWLETIKRMAILCRHELGYWPRRLLIQVFRTSIPLGPQDQFDTFDPCERLDERTGIKLPYRSALLGSSQGRPSSPGR